MVITRLGEGVDATGALSTHAIDRTVAVLETYKQVMDSYGVARFRSVATSAARDAANRELFFERARSVLGKAPELLDGIEEGKLSFVGAVAELGGIAESVKQDRTVGGIAEGRSIAGSAPSGPGALGTLQDDQDVVHAYQLVIDIGGGSTEIIFGNLADLDGVAVVSLDIGCVRLTERYFHHDPPIVREILEARRAAREALVGARSTITSCVPGRYMVGLAGTASTQATIIRRSRTVRHHLIGLAGTVSTIAALDRRLAVYDREKIHHSVLERSTVRDWAVTLASEPASARLAHAGMAKGREDVIAGGAIILDEAMKAFGRQLCMVSESDILDGIARSLLG
jgi:exopolyphosphatase/guanosine-5'-triphosphate,3'-diphosphate pyrophosphatase